MLDYELLCRLNTRSHLFCGPYKHIHILDIVGKDGGDFENAEMPYVKYKSVNDFYSEETMTILELVGRLVTLECYITNIEQLSYFFSSYDLTDFAPSIEVEYHDLLGVLTVKVSGARLGAFLPYELVEIDAVEKMTNRVINACRLIRLPLKSTDIYVLKNAIEQCVDRINEHRAMTCREMDIDNWFFPEEKFF